MTPLAPFARNLTFFQSNDATKRFARLALGLATWLAGPFTCLDAQVDPTPASNPAALQSGLAAEFIDTQYTPVKRSTANARILSSSPIPDRRLGGPLAKSRWNGWLQSQAYGKYQFHAFLAGTIRIEINDKVILRGRSSAAKWFESKPIDLDYDLHALSIEYTPAEEVAPHFTLFWQGPGFAMEPVPNRQFFHDPGVAHSQAKAFDRGAALYRALRCAACHKRDGTMASLPAPALDNLAGNLHGDWLVQWLTPTRMQSAKSRRMPHFDLNQREARAIAEYLLQPTKSDAAQSRRRNPDALSRKQRTQAEQLYVQLGCLACHRDDSLGKSDKDVQGSNGSTDPDRDRSLFDGGDLTQIAWKRPAAFFERWLENPSQVNSDHRMPTFDLSGEERQLLSAYLAEKGEPLSSSHRSEVSDKTVQRGRRLFQQWQCSRCHRGWEAADLTARSETEYALALHADSEWQDSCIASPAAPGSHRPHYILSDRDQMAIKLFVTRVAENSFFEHPSGKKLLQEENCLQCHQRLEAGAQSSYDQSIALRRTSQGDELLEFSTLRPPSLNSVGDKLHRKSLIAALRGDQPKRRPWLKVRMPQFGHLSSSQIDAIVDHFIAMDRIPPIGSSHSRAERDSHPPEKRASTSTLDAGQRLAAARLVTSDGFGCISCHAIGEVVPEKAAPGTRGPNLRSISQHVRQRWFERFVRSPARIIPQLEMPSIQTPVSGVLNSDLDRQLTALWSVLDDPDFDPPRPDPVRTLRLSGELNNASRQRAVVLTDVTHVDDQPLIKPFYVGLSNRHAMLFDLATASTVRWSIGDVANQRTDHKTWYWQAAGQELLQSVGKRSPEIMLQNKHRQWKPIKAGQFVTEADRWRHVGSGIELHHRLHFEYPEPRSVLSVQQTWHALREQMDTGIIRTIVVRNVPSDCQVKLRVVPQDELHSDGWQRGNQSQSVVSHDGNSRISVSQEGEPVSIDSHGWAHFQPSPATRESTSTIRISIRYQTSVPIDRYRPSKTATTVRHHQIAVRVPGFRVRRCPLPESIMPISIAWGGSNASKPDEMAQPLFFGSLKGRVWMARDTDGDRLQDHAVPFSDELASPYGLAGGKGYVDVLTKYALLRLHDTDRDGFAERVRRLASGWGHTADYHDWAVGLPQDSEGNYYVALPCQQDERGEAAAHLRGRVLQLHPKQPESNDPSAYALVEFAKGQRFPMGLAMNRHEQLFATDNQGNYNAFNELNHIQRGRHYGFINRRERRPGYSPTTTRAAIHIPHPWTRSVNGICFLETPDRLSRAIGRAPKKQFGPFEGHLLGCEYDTRRLIRMSLQRVGGVIQGAAYPFTMPIDDSEETFLGPIQVAVAPDGAIYVGSIRDSGWGGANNIGELVRLEATLEDLSCGIREVRTVSDGFVIDFTRPIERSRGENTNNYAVESYFRVSTPAYGGEDQDRKLHHVRQASVASDHRSVHIKVDRLAPDRNYDLHLRPLTADEPFFPAEAYVTVHEIP